MIRIQFSNGSTHRVVVPYKHQKQALINLAQAFVAQENSLLPESRTRYTPTIEAALADAQTTQTEAAEPEASRESSSEALKRTDDTARAIIRQIRSLLAGRFAQAPEQAQAWGFFVRQTGGGNILTSVAGMRFWPASTNTLPQKRRARHVHHGMKNGRLLQKERLS
ncbi:MAG: hypothetical protein DHS20C20_08900 [Ardenticatenaceae bacterium]|nr:MAG: hypothetical protein DHS20C20_08900 [Ardenticatenaceae bacterium]